MSKAVSIPTLPTVSLVMREVNGVELIFTSDGKLLAGQTDSGHVYYQDIDVRGKTEKKKCFRATFIYGPKEFHGGEPLEV
jgi:hypothetical protein